MNQTKLPLNLPQTQVQPCTLHPTTLIYGIVNQKQKKKMRKKILKINKSGTSTYSLQQSKQKTCKLASNTIALIDSIKLPVVSPRYFRYTGLHTAVQTCLCSIFWYQQLLTHKAPAHAPDAAPTTSRTWSLQAFDTAEEFCLNKTRMYAVSSHSTSW